MLEAAREVHPVEGAARGTKVVVPHPVEEAAEIAERAGRPAFELAAARGDLSRRIEIAVLRAAPSCWRASR